MVNNMTGRVVTAFFMLIIGIMLLGSIAGQVNEKTSTLTNNNDSNVLAATLWYDSGGNYSVNQSVLAFTLAPLGDTNLDCLITSQSIAPDDSTAALTAETDYAWNDSIAATGEIYFKNTTSTVNLQSVANLTATNYTYCPVGYLNQAWIRNTTNLVPGFFGLALMGIALWMLVGTFKEAGMWKN